MKNLYKILLLATCATNILAASAASTDATALTSRSGFSFFRTS